LLIERRGPVPADALSCSLDGAAEGGMTLQAIAEQLGVTREGVRQMEAKALPKLTRELERRGLLAIGAAEALKQVHRMVTGLRP
jgi:hypothetical protein